MNSAGRAIRRWLWAALVLTPVAGAHDYWFEPDPANGELLMYRGHRSSAHDGEIEPYGPEIVTGSECVDTDGSQRELVIVRLYPVPLPASCAGLFVDIDSGIWTETAGGVVNAVLYDAVDVLDRWRSLENIKLIERWHDALMRPLTDGLEIVPTENPLALDIGDKLRLRVVLNGEPVAGAPVAYHGDLRGVTDSDGHINIRIRHRGLQAIAASLEQSLDDSVVDRLIRTSALQFALE